jgi:hypothetical protein
LVLYLDIEISQKGLCYSYRHSACHEFIILFAGPGADGYGQIIDPGAAEMQVHNGIGPAFPDTGLFL